jgi:hypothetical protein
MLSLCILFFQSCLTFEKTSIFIFVDNLLQSQQLLDLSFHLIHLFFVPLFTCSNQMFSQLAA